MMNAPLTNPFKPFSASPTRVAPPESLAGLLGRLILG